MASNEAATAAPARHSDRRAEPRHDIPLDPHSNVVADNALRKMQSDAIPKPEIKATDSTLAKKTEWTLAISLNATIGGYGAGHKLADLQAIAGKTRGVPVAIVAQISQDAAGADSEAQAVERFVIRDGKVTNIGGSSPSKGFGQDLTDLLSTANKEAPSQKLGLWIQSHGGATAGLEGDNGSLPLDNLNKAISAGLRNSWHAKLDFLDFDSCLMGHTKVLDKMSARGTNVVASSETETYLKDTPVDGQNMKSAVTFLLEHPHISGASFAKTIVDQARAGRNSTPDLSTEGADTLAHFDLRKAPEFFSSLNELGFALAKAIKGGNQRQIEAIQSAISRAPSLPIDPTRDPSSDLKSFIDNVNAAAADGSITEPSVKSAIEHVREAQENLTPSYHGNARYGNAMYETQGGLAAYLPNFNFDLAAPGHSNQVLTPGLGIALKELHFENRKRIGQLVSKELDRIEGLLGHESQDELRQLRLDNVCMSFANTEPEFRRASAALNDRIRSLAGLELRHNLVREAHHDSTRRSFREILPVPGWQDFIEALNHKQ